MSIPIRCHNKRHFMLLLLLNGIEPNAGPRPPKYPCGVCKQAVKIWVKELLLVMIAINGAINHV